MAKYIIGVDLGGTKILSAIVTKNGNIVKKVQVPTQASRGRARVVKNIVRSIRTLLMDARVPLSDIEAIGVGAPGPVLFKEGVVLNPPNLPGWKRVPLKKILAREFRKKVVLDNDANAAALGEGAFGFAKGLKNFIFITVSTGIGGGLVIDGKLLRGAWGGAGEVGHMIIEPSGPRCGCGRRGCLEAMASGSAIARLAKAKLKTNKRSLMLKLAGGDISKVNAKTVEDAARSGDSLAKKIINRAARYLGMGLANLINILAPDAIGLGGGVMKMGQMFLGPAEKAARELSLSPAAKLVKIVRAKLGEDAGVIGAAALCMENK